MIDNLIEENFKLRLRVQELEQAIESHKSNTGNNLCWENDIELWKKLDESEYPHDTLPTEEEFLRNCKKYYDSRVKDEEPEYDMYYNGRG